ncbi:hypothetical protein BN946_scf184414.g8 [Trametes cinnabarina]|uniref:Lysophospholipase n=1 Tax=Pycnoporus cinnabarinus TaxID=5643 RepID=A0A060SQB0_PYCCI|nr:hypothetical protein BN946_scf184414.g8 [Trametes cinnabarina]
MRVQLSLSFVLIPLIPFAVSQSIAAQKYAPVMRPCPAGTQLVRNVGSDPLTQLLSPGEERYTQARRSQTLPSAWANYYLNVLQSTSQLLPLYVTQILLGTLGLDVLPNLGIATSGGGLRAALFGAGVLSVLDGRNQTSARAGMGGLLQAASYLSGLSGGSWLVLSLSQANFPTLPEVVFGTSSDVSGEDAFGGWITQFDLLEPGADANATAAFASALLEEVSLKWAEGFSVTVTDVWGRSLARHFVNGTTADNMFDTNLPHGAGLTMSSLPELPSFREYEQPFPIVLANSIASQPDSSAIVLNETGVVVPLTNPIYEFNVLIEGIRRTMPQSGIRLDAAQVPNPFRGFAQSSFVDANNDVLTLVDGGEDGETTPFQPLLVRARGIDTIIAIDAPADTADNWAAGDSLIATQDRVKLLSTVYSFPPVPTTQDEFLAHNLTRQPTFFGCDSSASSDEPFVIYLANGGAPLGEAPLTNTSTGKLAYTAEEAQAFLDQVHTIATQGISLSASDGNVVKDPEWPACLACAVVDRSRRRLGFSRAGVCVACFERYCWS